MLDPKYEIRNEDIDGVNEWIWYKEEKGGAWDSRTHWPNQKNKILENCKKFDVAIQAGGNQGMYPRLMANMFKTVYTFEPHWENFYSLVLNCNKENIIKINGALGDTATTVSLDGGSSGNMGTWKTTENKDHFIPQFRIDDMNLSSLDLIYLDVEGYEKNIINGAEQSINKFKPLIACENGNNVADILSALGYKSIGAVHSDTFFVLIN